MNTFSKFPRVACVMDLRGWESLWKTFATVGVANLFLFFIIVFVFAIDNPILIWILIAIESASAACDIKKQDQTGLENDSLWLTKCK